MPVLRGVRRRRIAGIGPAALLERVEDEVEAVLECGCEVVADLCDVAGDDLGEVRKLVRERGELLFLRTRFELTGLLLRDRSGPLASSNGTVFSWSAKP